jgi:hypothetical protein
MSDPFKQARDYQRELFQRLGEFFVRATGQAATDFSTIEGFSETISRTAHDIGTRGPDAFSWLHQSLGQLYSSRGVEAFRVARQLAGLKLVQAGSRFTASHLRSVQTALLYADTVLIPDPVAPWIESERREERFRDVLLLQNAHALLHLKPVVDADLPHLPVLVFPSWEKSLEERDSHTQQGIGQLIADTLTRFVDPSIQTYGEAIDYARKRPDDFEREVEKHRLIVAPGGIIGASAIESLTI